MAPDNDRRCYPRVRAGLPLKIVDRESIVVTQAENISCSGLYCKIDKSIPLITKVSMTLFVPIHYKLRKIKRKINIEGVVVRSEPINQGSPSDGYYIAIFFPNINKEVKDIIGKYVDYILPGNGH